MRVVQSSEAIKHPSWCIRRASGVEIVGATSAAIQAINAGLDIRDKCHSKLASSTSHVSKELRSESRQTGGQISEASSGHNTSPSQGRKAANEVREFGSKGGSPNRYSSRIFDGEMVKIMKSIVNDINKAGDDPGKGAELAACLRIANKNLKRFRELNAGSIEFNPEHLERGLLQHPGFLRTLVTQLHTTIDMPALSLKIECPDDRSSLAWKFPAGALLNIDHGQHQMVLIGRVCVRAREAGRILLWSFEAMEGKPSRRLKSANDLLCLFASCSLVVQYCCLGCLRA